MGIVQYKHRLISRFADVEHDESPIGRTHCKQVTSATARSTAIANKANGVDRRLGVDDFDLLRCIDILQDDLAVQSTAC